MTTWTAATPDLLDAVSRVVGKSRVVERQIGAALESGAHPIDATYCAEKLLSAMDKAAEALGLLGISSEEVQRRAQMAHSIGVVRAGGLAE